ncbi:Rab GTPase-binding exocyst subunit S15 [Diaporthe eres]|uniref:Rab GTPase-binding exocyst subunit S15 n=1 Tax=Diaporthe eres TaxID=83184 RepID=A0ABR1PLM3_DIAER
MNSTLLGLPREIKELIYYDALNHAAERILPEVKTINPNGVAAMAMDVQSLVEFVQGLDNSFMLMEVLQELEQTVKLLQAENADDFYDISVRNRHYGRVNAMNGPVLLEKLTHTVEAPNRAAATMANFSSRFGFKS